MGFVCLTVRGCIIQAPYREVSSQFTEEMSLSHSAVVLCVDVVMPRFMPAAYAQISYAWGDY